MSIDRMKLIDLWVGLPLCAILGTVSLLARRWRGQPQYLPPSPRRILVMKFFGLGSVIQAGPMLRAIRKRYPDSRFTFLTFPETAGLVRRMGVCDDIRTIRTGGLFAFVGDLLRQVLNFWADPVDMCIDLEFFSKFSTLVSLLSWSGTRVAFHLNNYWRWSVVTHPIYYNYYRHVSDVYADAAEAIGAPVTDRSPIALAIPDEARTAALEQLRGCGWDGRSRLIGINVNAGELSYERRWPVERFVVVIENLCLRDDVQPVLTGAANEVDYVRQVVERLSDEARRRLVNSAGKLSFDEFVAVMKEFDFLLTNDSGPLHIAYAQGTPSISLWGVGRPSFYGPRDETSSTLYGSLPCSPCLYMFTSEVGQWCKNRGDCMQRITVEDVWSVVERYLATAPDSRSAIRILQGW